MNEKGFTMLDGLVSFSFLLMITLSLLPLMFHMVNRVDEMRKDVIAARLLYEQIERYIVTGETSSSVETIGATDYILSIEQTSNQRWKACVQYQLKQSCISEPDE